MQQLDPGSTGTDIIYDTLGSTVWTVIEANTAIICACLPPLRVCIASICPRLLNPSPCRNPRPERHSSVPIRRSALLDSLDIAILGPEPPSNRGSPQGFREVMTTCANNRDFPNTRECADMPNVYSQHIPLGQITKKTDVDVQFDKAHDMPSALSSEREIRDIV